MLILILGVTLVSGTYTGTSKRGVDVLGIASVNSLLVLPVLVTRVFLVNKETYSCFGARNLVVEIMKSLINTISSAVEAGVGARRDFYFSFNE